MQIDATLLVQGCNFFLFYWIVRLFLFRPVVTYIQAKEHEKQLLHNAIVQCQDELVTLTNHRAAGQKEAVHYYMHNQPDILHNSINTVSLSTQESSSKCSPENVDQLVKATNAYLLDAITKGL